MRLKKDGPRSGHIWRARANNVIGEGLCISGLAGDARRLDQAIIADGTVYFGTTVYAGKVAFRPAIANWRTTERDVDIILGVARGLAERIATVHPLS